MKSEHINPFIDASVTTFETMCGVKPRRDGNLQIRSGMIFTYDFLGVLGMSGSLKGAVVMCMPVDVGMRIVGEFVGEEITEENSDLMDGFGELLNIIAGAAVAKIENHQIQLALPTVMIGKNQKLHGNQMRPWVVVPMLLPEVGKFNIEVAMEEK